MNLARPPLRSCQSAFPILADSSEAPAEAEVSRIRCPRCGESPRIEKIYVINLDREPGRWSKMEQELRHILDPSGAELLNLTERHVAIDANAFSESRPRMPTLIRSIRLEISCS